MPTQPSDTIPVLTITDLVCIRGGRIVIDSLSLTVGRGSIIRLSGANGSGKTSLLKIVAGLLRPGAGQVSCSLDDVAYAGHAVPVKPRLTVTENLIYWLDVYGLSYKPSMLDVLNLGDLANRAADSLSEGQKRRVAITPVLVSECQLWLLDEPMMSLDTETLPLLADALHSHCESGGTVLYTSPGHDSLPASGTICMASA